MPVRLDHEWGLDHKTWAVLCQVCPLADIPVVQLSLDASRPARFHHELGRRLAPLRDEGVVVVGSGNLVHNLRAYAWGRGSVAPHEWAVRFEQRVRELMVGGDDDGLIAYESLGPDAAMSIPTPEHYLPLLYVLALRRAGEPLGLVVGGV